MAFTSVDQSWNVNRASEVVVDKQYSKARPRAIYSGATITMICFVPVNARLEIFVTVLDYFN